MDLDHENRRAGKKVDQKGLSRRGLMTGPPADVSTARDEHGAALPLPIPAH